VRIYNARLLIRFPEHQNQAMLVFYHFSLILFAGNPERVAPRFLRGRHMQELFLAMVRDETIAKSPLEQAHRIDASTW
jgi:hypothetical protein